MKNFPKYIRVAILFLSQTIVWGANQTTTVSPIFPEDAVPFTLQIEEANFALPAGIQSFAGAIYGGKWLFLTGRTGGMHGVSNVGNNFPPSQQNTVAYVVDPSTGISWARSLSENSGLSQNDIDILSVVAPQFFQTRTTLYIVGGYGINTATGEMETKSTLTAVNIGKMMQWVIQGTPAAKNAIQMAAHPMLQVTGGALVQANEHQPMLLIMGQNFAGLYRNTSNGAYSMQVRPFWVQEIGSRLAILAKKHVDTYPDYRRRDTNFVPILQNDREAYVALSGVFTTTGGAWTVPVTIFPDGSSFEPDPNDPNTFKQGMNNYSCGFFGVYSTRTKEMFVVLPGGISYGFFAGGTFQTDDEKPFINQITTIKIDRYNNFTQFLMNEEFPFIESPIIPGNPLLFGANAQFFPHENTPLFSNGVIQLDALPKQPTLIGYIVGGIASSVPNGGAVASTASSYIFTVTLIPK